MTKLIATLNARSDPVEIRETSGSGTYHVALGDASLTVDARSPAPGVYTLLIDGASWRAEVTREDDAWVVTIEGERHVVTVEEEIRFRTGASRAAAHGGQTLRSPMPGKITHVAVTTGSVVTPGQTVVVIEAMKMENEMKAGVAGTVVEVRVQAGQSVNAGDLLLVIE